ncbi:hypothetical protein Tco_0587032 [Tanacetum coccineum]
MGDENHIRNLGDYSKPSHEGYRNTIELPVGNNLVPLQPDTIRTAKLCNDILMFQQHHGESLLEASTHFKDLLQKVPHHGIDRWFQIQIFYDHVSFHLKCEIDRVADDKLRDTNTDESWEIIENLALYDHEGWNDTKEFFKTVKAISTTQSTSKTPDRRLLKLEPQALGTTFEARVRDYMATHTERIERFEQNAIFKQREEINDIMTKMFRLLKELTTSRAPEKVLIREETKFPVTKNVSSISLTIGEEERSKKTNVITGADIEKPTKTETEMLVKEAEKEDEAKNEPKEKLEKKKQPGHLALNPLNIT